MWLSVIGLLLLISFLVLLFAPCRVICRWNGGKVEIRIRFLGLSFSVWERSVFERPKANARSSLEYPDRQSKDLILDVADRFLTLVRNWEVLVRIGRVLLRFARRFRRWWRLEGSTIEITLGLGNPAQTGAAIGALAAFGGLVESRWPRLHILGHADLNAITLHSRGEIIFRISAWAPLWDVSRMLLTLPWRALWKIRRVPVYQ